MKNKKEKGNRQKTKKEIYTKFAVLSLGGAGIGFIAGFAGAWITDMYEGDLWGGLREIGTAAVPVIYVLVMTVGFLYCFINYGKAKKMFANWNREDESILDEVDKILEKALTPSNILMVCNFFFYSAMIYISDIRAWEGRMEQTFLMVFGIIIFVIDKVLLIILQKLVVDLTKQLNPEKRGDVLDTEFQKEWLASCDEAEKKTIYEASYMAYRAASTACVVVWLFTLFGILLFDTGFFPSICVFIIWLTMVVSYSIACHKLEKK